MSVLNGGELVVETLVREKIDRVFSIAGGQFLPIYDAIRDRSDIELICPRHEGASAFMAAGWALVKRRPSVVMSTVGAGVIYEAGGLLFAFHERLPVLSLAPQVQSWRMKPIQESLQACDQDEIYRPFTKFRAIIYHYQRIPQLIRRAFREATAPEPGPVHLDIPVDILFAYKKLSEKDYASLFRPGAHRFEGQLLPNPASLEKAGDMLREAKRPLLLAGRGVDRAGAGTELARFLRCWEIPGMPSVAAYPAWSRETGEPLLPPRLWDEPSREVLKEADLLLLVEADEETARLAADLKANNPQLKVIQAAELASALDSLVPVECAMAASAPALFRELSELNPTGAGLDRDEGWLKKLAEADRTLKSRLRDELEKHPRSRAMLFAAEVAGKAAGENDFVVCEGETISKAALVSLQPAAPHRALIVMDQKTPGGGLPLSLGIKAAAPKSRVFLLSETSLFKRHARELQTQRRYGLAVASVALQDREKKPEHEVDFAKLSESLGVSAVKTVDPVEELSPDELARAADRGELFDASL